MPKKKKKTLAEEVNEPFKDIFADFFDDKKKKNTVFKKALAENETKLKRQSFNLKKELEQNNLALQDILNSVKINNKNFDNLSKAMMEVRKNTAPLQETMQVLRHQKSVTLTGGAVRKQSFRPDKTMAMVPQIGLRKSIKLDQNHMAKGMSDKFIDYMASNNLKFVHDIIKAHGKQKKKFVVGNNGNDEQAWNEVVQVLRSINMTPQEALDYSIGSVQTKARFIELRVVREYKSNSKYTVNSFIKIYRKHLASKKPLKVFAVSNDFGKWCLDNDLYFKSDENLRQNIKIMIKAWNEDNPKDKLPTKLK